MERTATSSLVPDVRVVFKAGTFRPNVPGKTLEVGIQREVLLPVG